jgi:hypothetical protein
MFFRSRVAHYAEMLYYIYMNYTPEQIDATDKDTNSIVHRVNAIMRERSKEDPISLRLEGGIMAEISLLEESNAVRIVVKEKTGEVLSALVSNSGEVTGEDPAYIAPILSDINHELLYIYNRTVSHKEQFGIGKKQLSDNNGGRQEAA